MRRLPAVLSTARSPEVPDKRGINGAVLGGNSQNRLMLDLAARTDGELDRVIGSDSFFFLLGKRKRRPA